jgi:hypothetical protein
MMSVDWLHRILDQLCQVRAQCPELRFGQLLATVGELAADDTGLSLWDIEDADFAAALERFAADIARRENRAEASAAPASAADRAGGKPSPGSAST